MFKKLFLFFIVVGTLLHASPASRISITKLYIATFDRVPDAKGLQYWLDSGWDIEAISTSFFDQKETKAKYPNGFSQTDFVQAIYKNLFDRDPDSKGFDYWLKALNNGQVDKSHFILATMNGALGDDAKLLNNKVIVGLTFVEEKRDDVEQAKAVIANVTKDISTVTQSLTTYKLGDATTASVAEKEKQVATEQQTDNEQTTNNTGQEGRTNSAPEITTTAPKTATRNAEYSYNPLATDVDNNHISWKLSNAPAGMSIKSSTGRVTWTPGEGVNTSGAVTLTATDDGSPAKTDTESFTITVTKANEAPTITTTASTTATEDTQYSYTPTATDTDNNHISWKLSNAPTGMSVSASTGKVTWTPLGGVSSSGEVTLTATDDGSPNKSDTESFTITVTQVNDAPVITTTAPTTATEDSEYSYTPTATDEESNSISWTLSGQPNGMSIDASTGKVTWTPLEGVTTSGAVTLTATDDGSPAKTDTESLTITVTQVNDTPIADSGDDQSNVEKGSVVTVDGSGSSDVDGDTLTYSWSIDTKPANSTAALSSASAQKPTFTADKVGTYRLLLKVNDGTVYSQSDSVTIEVVDTTSPTLAITDDTPEVLGVVLENRAWTADSVTFTFEFSESVTGFTADDITVSNGSKGTFSGADGEKIYTLVVTPTANLNAKDDISLSVAAGVAADASNNANESANTTQAFDLEAPFVTVWKTDNGGVSDDDQIKIGTDSNYVYNYTIDWGDGNIDVNQDRNSTHTYGSSGEYTIKIRGKFPHFVMEYANWDETTNKYIYTTDNDKLLQVVQWGTQEWKDMSFSFISCSKLDGEIIDDPNLNSVTDMSSMFGGASNFNQPLDSWDVSKVADMMAMFDGASAFDQDISGWNVSNVINMSGMFGRASVFNQDISDWNVSSVEDMSYMFYQASAFDRDIGGWNVSSVTNMSGMFYGATAFNQPLDSWDVSNVTDMSAMFNEASNFNQPLDSWTVTKVTNMHRMFDNAYNFDQDISSWDVSNVTDMHHMFSWALAFNHSIDSWDVSKVTDMSYMFEGYMTPDPKFNQPLNSWNVSNVTNMSHMFYKATAFKQSLNSWNVSKVTDMESMFEHTHYFNGEIGNWDVSKVTNMSSMFAFAQDFNQSLNWDVSSVTNMHQMFFSTDKFDQDISGWNVSNVRNMSQMFSGASAFDGDISGWNVSNVTDMSAMFSDALAFNQNISDWDVSSVTDMSGMFDGASKFNQPLDSWNVSKVTDMSYMFYRASAFTNQDLSGWSVTSVIHYIDFMTGAGTENIEPNWQH